jgi:fatty acid desaturase
MNNTLISAKEIRERLLKELPKNAFKNVPEKAFLFIPLNLIVVSLIYVIYAYDLAWYWALLISIILGQTFTTLDLLAHEVMHGSVVKSKKLQDLLCYIGFYPALVTPTVWRIWHVRAHHGNTNTERDPDASINIQMYNTSWWAKLWSKLLPASKNTFAGLLYFTYWFTAHGQTMLWLNKKFDNWNFDAYGFNKRKAIIESIFIYLGWGLLIYVLGFEKSVYAVFIPMMIMNAILLMFISCQHLHLPRTETNEENHPLLNTVSMKIPKLVQLFNINFQNHVEHHLFPSMNYKYTPLVKEWLRKNMQAYYMEPSVTDSLKILFNTPRVYYDNNYLFYPNSNTDDKVDTRQIRDSILNIQQ